MMRWLCPRVLAAAAAFAATAALAGGAPEPQRPFDPGHMTGRWFEIARTPTDINRDCQGSATEWQPTDSPSKFRIIALCRKGSPTGPASTVKGTVSVIDQVSHAKVKMSVFGGLLSQEYWLLDHADDYSWLIMGTPNGKFVSIMSIQAHPAPQVRAAALQDAARLGYDISKLAFPTHAP
jgi:apolipoprotein D and lipocalin family protein